MKIEDYFTSGRQKHWLNGIARCDWRAGQYLHQLLRENRFHTLLGGKSRLLLLTEGDSLISFCTYAQRDEIPMEALTPWAGFVYTYPQHRGKRRMGKLLELYGRALHTLLKTAVLYQGNGKEAAPLLKEVTGGFYGSVYRRKQSSLGRGV